MKCINKNKDPLIYIQDIAALCVNYLFTMFVFYNIIPV